MALNLKIQKLCSYDTIMYPKNLFGEYEIAKLPLQRCLSATPTAHT